jgi:hypothetical protein
MMSTQMAHRADEPLELKQLSDLKDFDEIDVLFGATNPNPERTGCPSRATLLALAQRRRNLNDPAYEHLTQCSPCYCEFRLVQEDGKVGSIRGVWWLSIAAALLLLIAGGWIYRAQQVPSPTGPVLVPEPQRAELDLRPYTVVRSGEAAPAGQRLEVGKGDLDLTVLLATGAEPGPYDLRLVDASSHELAIGSGRADIRNFVTTLQARLDLRSVPVGEYRLMVRRAGDDWHTYPVAVR